MKRNITAFISAIFLIAITSNVHAEFYLAKITDFLGDTHYEALSKEEFMIISSNIRAENNQFSRAQRIAESKWNREKPMRYPGRSLHPRKILSVKRFRTIEEANLAVAKKGVSAQLSEEKKTQRNARKNNQKRGGRKGRNAKDLNRSRRESRAQKQRQNLKEAETYFTCELEKLLNSQKYNDTTTSTTETEDTE
jgi:hypothetical protein